jgi:PRTRC genetic system ThiF family protein
MKFIHTTNSALFSKPVDVVVIGAGGTGSALMPRLMQLHWAMLELGHPHGLNVTLWDDDTVSKSNIGRQCFFPADVGQRKASLLINRLNVAWGTQWQAVTRKLDASHEIKPDIIIGCVDSRKGRAAILKAVRSWHCYYIDSGNGEDSGQVVLGEILGRGRSGPRLPHVGDLFSEMIDVALDAVDDKPSCSVAEALQKQSLPINNAMAQEIFNLMWMLFRHGKLEYSGRFVNLKTGLSNPIRIDTEVFKRMGYVSEHPFVKPAPAEKLAA